MYIFYFSYSRFLQQNFNILEQHEICTYFVSYLLTMIQNLPPLFYQKKSPPTDVTVHVIEIPNAITCQKKKQKIPNTYKCIHIIYVKV